MTVLYITEIVNEPLHLVSPERHAPGTGRAAAQASEANDDVATEVKARVSVTAKTRIITCVCTR